MDPEDSPELSEVRHRDSPQRWTQVTQTLPSPIRSIHPEHAGMSAQMESIDSQADFGHRTTDFFDAGDSEDETALPGTAITSEDSRIPRSSSPSKRKRLLSTGHTLVSRCEPKRVALPPEEELPQSGGYQRLDSNLNQQIPRADTMSTTTSFNGSVDELDLLPGREHSHPQMPKPARISSRGTADIPWDHEQDPSQGISPYPGGLDQRLGMHAFAYDMLLRGLYADEEVMQGDQPIQPIVSRASAIPSSMIPQQLRLFDPRSPRDQLPTPGTAGLDGNDQVQGSGKKAHCLPPPIDTNTRRSLPAGLVRTPYPLSSGHIHRKDFGRDQEPPSALDNPPGASESILTLSIRRVNPNSTPRVTSIMIPVANDYTAVRTTGNGEKQKQFRSISFDDAELFWQLRDAYKGLAGVGRFFSARSLKRIVVSGQASRAADAGYGWLHQPRSPRVLAYKGLTDTFSEENILQHYRRPVLGKSRYAFVHWAHRLAAAPTPAQTPMGDERPVSGDSSLVRRQEQPEGIEFVVSWSVKRILLFASLIILLSGAAALLWIFLGTSSSFSWFGASAGFRNAGHRVGTGILIGVLVLLIGMSGFSGWLAVSYLVM
ncbi:hypothetical protein CLAFUW4_09325 [Fulvia fulva]|uniref:Uncharacterized protein n=1 Tax=Passalora fulva TaxID=5499 RepID=A0A9Q8PGU4_PASFU|nr:uncharacterized protein CLAFUR5_09425 [Fulvia fulva]KAK4614088.1 hypothetical protein CLAFUR4_09331 [Fulvia fulva]KAK4615285.1 hypothetical protein CLAFUR0_09323 [Fulvia fulva]UJO22379.1 hypothetical protein CLAFUR5_09425 [Fulvia fulva]WPV19815.1 hypothetical protein CLAFUW4_09325 [Fulvia fulva]WPV35676.1 hypothetical protein CLAFUW7_09326 [Fulvia fulva]